jgi:hypothetical protein
MKGGALGFTLAIALLARCVLAEPYEDESLRMDVPVGFQGPVASSQGGTDVVAFRWPYPSGDASTLLQITKYELPSASVEMPEDDKGKAAEVYLRRFLDGVARRRTSFESSDTVRLDLGGLPGAKISWAGMVRDRWLSGVVYCVVVGKKVISFHTQDFEPAPIDLREAIMKSVETVVLKHDP